MKSPLSLIGGADVQTGQQIQVDGTARSDGQVSTFSYDLEDDALGTDTFLVTLTWTNTLGNSNIAVTSSIAGVCSIGLAITPAAFGLLSANDISSEILSATATNTGSVSAALNVRGAGDLVDSGDTPQILLSNLKFDTVTSAFAAKTSLTTSDQSLGTIIGTPVELYLQLEAILINAFFADAVSTTAIVSFQC